MGATTVLPSSLLPRRSAAADLHSCAPRLRINPATMANPAASSKKPKQASYVRGGESPAKRVRGVGEPHLAAAVNTWNKKPSSSVRGGLPPVKRVRAMGEPHLAAAVTIGSKNRPSSVRSGEPPAKRLRGVSKPHLAAAVDIRSKKLPCPSSDKDPKKSLTCLDAVVIKKQCSIQFQGHLREITVEPKPSIRELIQKARQAKAAEEAVLGRIAIEHRRTEARRKLELMVATVEFNDPFIHHTDVFMSRQQLKEAREAEVAAQDRIIEMARRREMEALKRSKPTGVLR